MLYIAFHIIRTEVRLANRIQRRDIGKLIGYLSQIIGHLCMVMVFIESNPKVRCRRRGEYHCEYDCGPPQNLQNHRVDCCQSWRVKRTIQRVCIYIYIRFTMSGKLLLVMKLVLRSRNYLQNSRE